MSNAITFIRGSVRKPQAAGSLEELAIRSPALAGEIIYGYPLGHDSDNRVGPVDAVFVSPKGQVTVIDLVEDAAPGDYQDRQDQAFIAVTRKLQNSRPLMDGRRPKVKAQTATFGPRVPESDLADQEHPLLNPDTLTEALERFQANPPEGLGQAQVTSAILAMHSDFEF